MHTIYQTIHGKILQLIPADTPVLMLSAWLSDTGAPIGASNPIIAKEGNTVYFRNNMNNFIDNPISTANLYSSAYALLLIETSLFHMIILI